MLIGSSALEPMLLGPAAVPVNTSQLYTLKMRPCWPYADTVNCQLNWGDGAQASFSSPAATWVQTQHAWTAPGPKSLSLVAVRDSHGRVFNATTGRNVDVNAGAAGHLGMTWRVLEQRGAYAHVGADAATNPYNGDAGPNAAWPVLCLRRDGRPAPPAIPFDFYNGWAAGEVRTTGPILGSALTSRAVADGICAAAFGAGFRMAEFHDGGGGWTWWAEGTPLATVRLWVAIDDQLANPWN